MFVPFFSFTNLQISVDQIYHLASPASPPHYMYNPIKVYDPSLFLKNIFYKLQTIKIFSTQLKGSFIHLYF